MNASATWLISGQPGAIAAALALTNTGTTL